MKTTCYRAAKREELPVGIDELIRTKRKTLGLTVMPDARVIVRAPKRLPLAYIEEFVRKKTPWILSKQQQMRALAPKVHKFEAGEMFFLLGEPLCLQFEPAARGVSCEGGMLFLPPVGEDKAKKLLEDWYRKQAREVFARRVAHFAPLMGVKPAAVRLSGARGRWGSCGPQGSINLVWRLVMAPPEIIDYLVVHELAHLKRRDHSAAFWGEVARILPEYAKHRQYLKKFGRQLDI